ncbi:uncharacterized protein [Misgurnus anguillicaudatus]|uniref:uncharacterized protein n=1 Tax=Misgurnus anguillicaudatus TaxID=75329 RepID=UPI003CCEFC41
MSKLQFLNVFLTDRLTLAAQEIFKAVEDIFSEYNEEICRSRKEIEVLRRRLQQAGLPLDSETQSCSNGTRDTPALSEAQLRCEEDKKDTEVQIKLELYTEEEKNEVQTSVCNGSTSVLPCMDADDDQMACKDIEAQMMDNSENDFPSFIYQDVQIKNEPELHAESGNTCQAQHFTRHSSDDPGLPFRDEEMLTQHRMELDEINESLLISPIQLRVIIGPQSSQRVILQYGMPTSVSDLSKEIKKQCNLQGNFRLQFMDPEFDNEFFNLESTSEIQDRSTLKVVCLKKSSDTDNSPIPYVNTSQSGTACSLPALSLSSCDALLSPPSTSANFDCFASVFPQPSSSIKSSTWPAVFTVPRFAYDAELKLEQGNAIFKRQGIYLSPDPKLKISILDGLAEEIVKYKVYPSDAEYTQVAEALIKKHPCLKERGSVNGYSGWKTSLKYKLGNYRAKLRNIGCAEVIVNSLKHKPDGISSPAYQVKKPRKAEVNYCPSLPQGETPESLEAVRLTLLSEIQKKNNEANVRMLMDKSFSVRRHEVVKDSPLIANFKDRWPALFRMEEICAEFERITTVPLVSTFFAKMDKYSAKLMKLFAKRGGVYGQRIKNLLITTTLTNNIDVRRECVLRSLSLYLNEEPSGFIREYMDTDVVSTEEGIQNTLLGVFVIKVKGSDIEHRPANVGVVLEGLRVLEGLNSVTHGAVMLMGLIYALNLSYPPELRYTFEIMQKLFLELDGHRLSSKVQMLKTKLFSDVFE